MLRTILIDDEIAAHENLELKLNLFGDKIQVIEKCTDAKEGMKAIAKLHPDLIFLDVEMPAINGIELLEMLDSVRFQVIFVTGHQGYALQAIRLSAIDYILKPADPELLEQAIDKAILRKNESDFAKQYRSFIDNTKASNKNLQSIALPTQEGLVFARISDIIKCKADGNYTSISLINKDQLLISRPIKEFEKLLETNSFCRVHNSHLINLNQVKKYVKGDGGYVIMNDDSMVEISRQKKEDFMNAFKKL